ncbi:MAG: alpha/beta fold hydrolase [Anaerolineae bacterium]|nr:MAG: alpha/beta fold hydrolase [Anaerolineae bacterium]
MRVLPSKKFRRLFLAGALFFVLLMSLAILWVCWQVASSLTTDVPRVAIVGSPTDFGAENWREVTFTSSDGLQLNGWFVPPRADLNGATVLLVHGHGGSRLDYMNIAPFLVREGYGLLMFDLRASGTSEGEIVTMGCKEVWDVEAAFDFLTQQPEVNPDRIAIFGHSMGGTGAIRAMTRLPQARVLIASAAYSTFAATVADGVKQVRPFPAFPIANIIVQMVTWQSDCDLSEVRPIDDIPHISPRAALLIQGTDDETIRRHNADELFAAARAPKELYVVEGAGHGDVYETDPAEYERRVLDFLSQYLRGDYLPADN